MLDSEIINEANTSDSDFAASNEAAEADKAAVSADFQPSDEQTAETVTQLIEKSGFKFFKNCSASLKRFSVLLFAVNLFLLIIGTVLAVVLVYLKFGSEILMLAAIPIASLVIIFAVFTRFISALVYGFAEIVEKYENNP